MLRHDNVGDDKIGRTFFVQAHRNAAMLRFQDLVPLGLKQFSQNGANGELGINYNNSGHGNGWMYSLSLFMRSKVLLSELFSNESKSSIRSERPFHGFFNS